MERWGIPNDLRAFLDAGSQLEYDDDECEVGRVRLYRLEDLPERTFRAQTYGTPHAEADPHAEESGTYAVRGFDLIESCTGDYDPEGLLVWFPAEGRYGVCDTDHDYILLFAPEVQWSDVVKVPPAFLNAQWADEDDAVATEFLAPWHKHPWGE